MTLASLWFSGDLQKTDNSDCWSGFGHCRKTLLQWHWAIHLPASTHGWPWICWSALGFGTKTAMTSFLYCSPYHLTANDLLEFPFVPQVNSGMASRAMKQNDRPAFKNNMIVAFSLLCKYYSRDLLISTCVYSVFNFFLPSCNGGVSEVSRWAVKSPPKQFTTFQALL